MKRARPSKSDIAEAARGMASARDKAEIALGRKRARKSRRPR